MDLHAELTAVFRAVFNQPGLELADGMSAKDIEEWDSLNHINLIVAMEKHFRIKIPLAEIAELQDIGGMKRLLERLLPR